MAARARTRLDLRLVELGLADSQVRAQAYIAAGEVRLADRIVDKPGTLVAADLITRVQPLPGGMHVVTLTTGQDLQVSRIQSRLLRERFLKL